MKNVDVSIVVVSYNHEKYIKEAITSVLKQKVNFNYEIIFADDNSQDKTKEIIKRETKKLKNVIYLFSDTNRGNTFNSINAYKHAQGKYIVALEADDYWYSEEKLQTQYDFLESNPEYIAVSNKRFTINSNGNKLTSYPLGINKDTDITLKDFLHGKTFSGIESMFHNIFKENKIDKKYIDLIQKDRMIVDLPLCIFLLSNGSVRILNKDYSVYRTATAGNNNNYNSSLKLMKIARDQIIIINRLEEYYQYDFSYLYASHLLEAKIGLVLEKNLNEYREIKKLIPKNNHVLNFKMLTFFPLFFRNFINKVIKHG